MYCLVDLNSKVRMASWHEVTDIFLIIVDDEIGTHIDGMINCINRAMSNVDVNADGSEKQMLGFSIPNGFMPILHLFNYGMRNGSFDERASAVQLMSLLNVLKLF